MTMKTATRRRTKTTKSGRRELLALAAGMIAGVLPAAGKKERRAQTVIAGTVFRETGFALRGAEVLVEPVEGGGGKKTEWRAVTDARGEFAIRVPAGRGAYRLVVTADGYKTYQKQVSVDGDERVEFNVIMETK